ncbi:MAG: flagellar hook capping FlgD N-terminal domain-containing protein [Phycisphaerales bacterium]
MGTIDAFSNNTTPTSTTDAFSALSSGEFLQIIFTELQNQDPLQPNDTSAMLDQLSTLRTIEADTQMTQSLSQLVAQNEFASASGLIGSLVSGISLDNRRVADLVVSVSMTQDGPVLNLFDGSRMFFRNIDEIVGPLDDPTPPDDNQDDDIDNDNNNNDDNNNDNGSNTTTPLIGNINPGNIDPNTNPNTEIDIDPSRRTVSLDV